MLHIAWRKKIDQRLDIWICQAKLGQENILRRWDEIDSTVSQTQDSNLNPWQSMRLSTLPLGHGGSLLNTESLRVVCESALFNLKPENKSGKRIKS